MANSVVPLAGDVDRNMVRMLIGKSMYWSSPSRGTWIEIFCRWCPGMPGTVVPLAGDVDRNYTANGWTQGRGKVVPLAGDVDRNRAPRATYAPCNQSSPSRGTWIEIPSISSVTSFPSSSPSRGTWIEIVLIVTASFLLASSPSRGTWIEICRKSYFKSSRNGRPPRGGRG